MVRDNSRTAPRVFMSPIRSARRSQPSHSKSNVGRSDGAIQALASRTTCAHMLAASSPKWGGAASAESTGAAAKALESGSTGPRALPRAWPGGLAAVISALPLSLIHI